MTFTISSHIPIILDENANESDHWHHLFYGGHHWYHQIASAAGWLKNFEYLLFFDTKSSSSVSISNVHPLMKEQVAYISIQQGPILKA